MEILANADTQYIRDLLDSPYVERGYKADIKVELAERGKRELTLSYGEVYDMSDFSIHRVFVEDIPVSDGTFEEIGNEMDRRIEAGTYTFTCNPYGWDVCVRCAPFAGGNPCKHSS